jgi:hypothetical protein
VKQQDLMCKNAAAIIAARLKLYGKAFYSWTLFNPKRVHHSKVNWFRSQFGVFRRDPEIDVNEKRPWKWRLLTNDSSLGQRIEQQHGSGSVPSVSRSARQISFRSLWLRALNIIKGRENHYCSSAFSVFNTNDLRIQDFLEHPKPEVQSAFLGIQDLLNDSSDASDEQIKQLLLRIHKNCGHPSPALLQIILTEAKAPSKVIGFSKHLECSVCARLKKLTPARPTNPTRARKLGSVVSIDFSHHEIDKKRFQVFHVVDEASRFHWAKFALVGKR